jgi:hypothetical protein
MAAEATALFRLYFVIAGHNASERRLGVKCPGNPCRVDGCADFVSLHPGSLAHPP